MPSTPDTLIQKVEPRLNVGQPPPAPVHAPGARDTGRAATPVVRMPEPEKPNAQTSAPIIDNLVPGWQPARFSMQTLIVLAIVVAAMLLLSAGLMVVHRLFHFIKSGGWSKTPVEISELGVAGVFTLKQAQSVQQQGDRVRDTELAALTARVDAAVLKHDSLSESITGVYGMLGELSVRVDRMMLGHPQPDEAAGVPDQRREGDADAGVRSQE